MTELMVAVERVVRPVRVGSRRKSLMREELLAHLTDVYGRERAALGDDRLAMTQAVRRFGIPSDLTRDLERSATRRDRFEAAVEWGLGWGGEPGLRFVGRLAGLIFVVTTILMAIGLSVVGPGLADRTSLQVATAYVVTLSASIIPLGLAYGRVRGAVCGGLGRTRSWSRAAGWAAAAGLVAPVVGLVVCLLGGAGEATWEELLPSWGLGAAVTAVFFVAFAYFNGPREIRFLTWECLPVAD